MRFLWPRHGLDSERVGTGQTQGGYIPTHAPAMAPGEHARVTRCKPREWHQRQERRALAAPRSCTKCARSVCHGHCLRHCSRAARRCRSISRAHPMRAHIVRSRGQVAVHSRTPAVAARMPPAVLLVINLRIRAAADCCCGSSSSLLLPDSVKPAVQRGVQNSRGLVPPEAERVQTR